MRIDYMQMEFLDPKLRQLMKFVETETGFEFTGTSIYRMYDPGVHGTLPVRGFDIRMRNHDVGAAIERMVNVAWEYNANKPHKNCALLHGDGSELHLHLQVHPNTELMI